MIKREFTEQELFEKVNPLIIYQYYYPGEFALNRPCLNPFVKDSNPSFIIGNKYGDVTHKAFNSSHRGGAIQFVMSFYQLEYHQAIDKILEDFGFTGKSNKTYEEIVKGLPEIVIRKKTNNLIQIVPTKWTQEHINFFKRGGLDVADLNFPETDTIVYPLKKFRVNKGNWETLNDEVAFGYNLKNDLGDWIKLYFPFREKRKKWFSNIPFTQVHWINNIKDCDTAIITKSIKDGALLRKYITPCVAVVQAEDLSCFSEEFINYMNFNSKNTYISFDNDQKGVDSCKSITSATGWKYVNPPKKYLDEGITDWFDLSVKYGIEKVIDHFKNKKVIN